MKKIKFAFCLLLVLILSMQCLGVSAATPYANYFIVAGEDEMTLPTPAAYEVAGTLNLSMTDIGSLKGAKDMFATFVDTVDESGNDIVNIG